jgi:hypothetical protein
MTRLQTQQLPEFETQGCINFKDINKSFKLEF